MSKLYSFLDYREAVRWLLKSRPLDKDLNQNQVATLLGITPSYLSRVLQNKADLNSDQLFIICERLELNSIEAEYLFLLLEYQRCGYFKRKSLLKSKVQSLRKKMIKTQETIPTDDLSVSKANDSFSEKLYYLDPWHMIVHISMSIPRYQTNPKLLAKDLGINEAKLSKYLAGLVELKLLSLIEKKYQFIPLKLHLGEDSLIFKLHQEKLRNLQSYQEQRLSELKDYFSTNFCFSANEDAVIKIKIEFNDFLKKFDQIIQDAPPENTYQFNFSIFPWTHI